MESSDDIVRHHMTHQELVVKKALCQLLIDKGHRKYAERFWKFDFNIVDSTKHPDFTAAISFEDATVFVSDGFLGTTKKLFDQLDVLLRHEMAHYLMMHFIRSVFILKKRHEKDSIHSESGQGTAWDRISSSAKIHDLLNIIEDFEISHTRYSNEDKDIVRTMTLNGRIIGGLLTEEDHPGWETMTLEEMFTNLVVELENINRQIRTDPNWQPTKDGYRPREIAPGKTNIDPIKYSTAQATALYADISSPSNIDGEFDVFIDSKRGKKIYGTGRYAKLLKYLYAQLKDFKNDPNKQPLLDEMKNISETGVLETYDLIHPTTGNIIEQLYTPEEKYVAINLLKYLCDMVKQKVQISVVKASHSPEYVDAHNKTIRRLDTREVTDETLESLLQQLENY